jgi:hypothetical protein
MALRSNKPIDARAACTALGRLASNGTTTLQWLQANKDRCRIPDHFVQNIRTDHDNVSKLRGQACNVAARQAETEKKAKGLCALVDGWIPRHACAGPPPRKEQHLQAPS